MLAQLGLAILFSLKYQREDIEIREITFVGLQKRQFQMPVFETIRRTGTEERIIPSPERWQLNSLDTPILHALSKAGQLDILANSPYIASIIRNDPVISHLLLTAAGSSSSEAFQSPSGNCRPSKVTTNCPRVLIARCIFCPGWYKPIV